MPLTLEERERLAYITNHPAHKIIALALEAEHAAIDEMRHEADTAKEELRAANERISELEDELEDELEAAATPAPKKDPVLA